MPLQNFQYDTIIREYNRKQARNRHLQEAHREAAYARIPRLQEIDEKVASLSAAKIRSILTGQERGTDDLKESLAQLAQERTDLLKSAGLPADYLDLPCDCPVCHDTGYVGSEKCVCFKQAENDLLYTQSFLTDILEEENFEHFSFDYYSDTIKNEATGLSALATARKAYDLARSFVTHFDTHFENLFLYGNTGVGKTFLSHCIAGELLKSSHSVLYFSAYDLFDHLAENTFGKNSGQPADDNIFTCDLLIIDDLGTELNNRFVSSQLFLCINERIMRRKSTVISTNLTLEEFSAAYSERTFSRIASHYQMIKLIGKDIRIQKIFRGGK